MAAPASPKFDFKMLILPAILLFSKKIDFKDPEIVKLAQIGFSTGTFTLLCQSYKFLISNHFNNYQSQL